MLDNAARFALLPRDAFHVAMMQRLGIVAMASDDMDFDRVDGIERHWIFNSSE
jgi:predicted nucleic acid-binding protein